MHDYQRPPTLYRYGVREDLELALTQGQFILMPANSCLVIHNSEEFGERLHRAVQRTLPSWAGIDGAVEYGVRAALGAAFTKSSAEAEEREWQFAWRAMAPQLSMNPVTVKIGSIESFGELRERESYPV